MNFTTAFWLLGNHTWEDIAWTAHSHIETNCSQATRVNASSDLSMTNQDYPDASSWWVIHLLHYSDVIIDAMASQITRHPIVYSTVHSGRDQTKHQSSTSLVFVRGIHQWSVNSPHKWPVTGKCFHSMTSSWDQLQSRYISNRFPPAYSW